MSRIDELIREMCPNGVHRASLVEVADAIRGLTYKKSDEDLLGPTKILRGNNIDAGTNSLIFDSVKTLSSSVDVKSNHYLRAGDIVMSGSSGSISHVGKVAYVKRDLDYVFGGFMICLRAGSHVNSKFLYFVLSGRQFRDYLSNILSTSTINNINRHVLSNFLVPVPPLAVQEEIVRILDTFTNLEAELEAQLEAELSSRLSQFESLKQRLLFFPADIPRYPLDELAEYVNGKAHERAVASDGTVPLITARFVSTGGQTDRFIHPEDILTSTAQGDTTLVLSDLPRGRALAKAFFIKNDSLYAVNQRIARIRPKQTQIILPRFLFYLLDRNPKLLAHDNGADQTHLSKLQVTSLLIPVPPIEIQKNVVGILDSLESLRKKLTYDLPAEISARRKQYEYYRDGLLMFEELVA